jgi:LacI family transcriptional regulator
LQARPGLAEVARESGVSVSTASRALNRPEMVSPEVVGRIREIAKRLGYAPNPFARSLRLQASKTIGLIVPDNTNPFFAEVAKGVEAACFRAGYTLVLCNSDRSHHKEADQARVLLDNRVDGVLIFTVDDASVPAISWLRDHAVPVVVMERHIPGLEVDCVVSDNAGGVCAALQHLAALGHQRVAMLCGDPAAAHYAERLATFQQCAADLSLDAPPHWIRTKLNSFADGQNDAIELLSAADRPSAIFCATDTLAIGAIRAAARCGLRVPGELSVIGFGDIEVASYVQPPLTTVAQQKFVAGDLAVRLLLRRIRRRGSDRPPPSTNVIVTQLIVRESTGPASHATTAAPNGEILVAPVRPVRVVEGDGLWGLE